MRRAGEHADERKRTSRDRDHDVSSATGRTAGSKPRSVCRYRIKSSSSLSLIRLEPKGGIADRGLFCISLSAVLS